MIPMVKAMATKMSADKVSMNMPSTQKIIKIAVGAGVVAIAYFLISRRLRKQKEKQDYNEMEKAIGTKTPTARYAQFASLYYSAMKQAGPFGWGMGTDEELVYKTTESIRNTKTPFGQVAKAYYKLYRRPLLTDLQKELKPSEYAKFQKILNQIQKNERFYTNR